MVAMSHSDKPSDPSEDKAHFLPFPEESEALRILENAASNPRLLAKVLYGMLYKMELLASHPKPTPTGGEE
jgi:hypothetical protein